MRCALDKDSTSAPLEFDEEELRAAAQACRVAAFLALGQAELQVDLACARQFRNNAAGLQQLAVKLDQAADSS